jgi:CheY-like chemotaxis protein
MTNENEILIVDDSASDVELTVHTLRKSKLANKIHVAEDGAQALDFLFCRGAYADRSFARPPRVVLLDLKMPRVDGIEVLRAVRGDPRTKAIPVVVLTSSKEQKDLVESYNLGVNAYIQKPVDFDRFREVVEQIGMFWLVVNEPPPLDCFGEERPSLPPARLRSTE